jgi:hypothetical protein
MKIRLLLLGVFAIFFTSGYALSDVSQPKVKTTPKHKTSVPVKKPQVQANKSKSKTATKQKTPDASKKHKKIVQPKWRIFNSPDGSFAILMPGKPQKSIQVQKTAMGKINLHIFLAQPPEQKVAYLVTYNEFPYEYAQMNSPEKIFSEATSSALLTTQSHLVSQSHILSFHGYPEKEIIYVDSAGKMTTDRMYFADSRLYQVMAIVSKKQRPTLSKTITGFLNSFHLVNQKVPNQN